jgi:hypothetical protein
MRPNFGVIPDRPGALEPLDRLVSLALPVGDPAHRVQNLWVFGCQLDRPFNQSPGFIEPDIAVREGVTERVVGVGMIWAKRDQAPQVTFHAIKPTEAFAEHRAVIEKLGFVRLHCEASVDDIEGFRGATVFAQQFGARLDHSGSVARGFGVSAREESAAVVGPLESAQHQGPVHQRLDLLVAIANPLKPAQGLLGLALVFGHARQKHPARVTFWTWFTGEFDPPAH